MPFAITVDENNNQEFMISSINVKYSKKGHNSQQWSEVPKEFSLQLGQSLSSWEGIEVLNPFHAASKLTRNVSVCRYWRGSKHSKGRLKRSGKFHWSNQPVEINDTMKMLTELNIQCCSGQMVIIILATIPLTRSQNDPGLEIARDIALGIVADCCLSWAEM